jgi:hypothetical protein
MGGRMWLGKEWKEEGGKELNEEGGIELNEEGGAALNEDGGIEVLVGRGTTLDAIFDVNALGNEGGGPGKGGGGGMFANIGGGTYAGLAACGTSEGDKYNDPAAGEANGTGGSTAGEIDDDNGAMNPGDVETGLEEAGDVEMGMCCDPTCTGAGGEGGMGWTSGNDGDTEDKLVDDEAGEVGSIGEGDFCSGEDVCGSESIPAEAPPCPSTCAI